PRRVGDAPLRCDRPLRGGRRRDDHGARAEGDRVRARRRRRRDDDRSRSRDGGSRVVALTRLALAFASGCWLGEPPPGLCAGDFEGPIKPPDTINTPMQNEDGGFLLHADLDELFFNRNDPGSLYHARRAADGSWMPPTKALGDGQPHANPHVSADG